MGPKDSLFRVWTGIHRKLFVGTKGRLGGKLFGMPVLMLTTTGRKSGRPRQNMLTAPIVRDGSLVLVASFGGDPRHPQWFKNIEANPDVRVTMKGSTKPMRARVVTGEEKAAMWPEIVKVYRGYAMYQKRTEREIPVVVLDPA